MDKFNAPVLMHWNSDQATEMANEYLFKTRQDIGKRDISDFEVANGIYLVGRDSFDLIVWQTAAKERIRWLSVQLAAANEKIKQLESAPRIVLDETNRLAREAYNAHITNVSNGPNGMHSNRYPTWEELRPQQREMWCAVVSDGE